MFLYKTAHVDFCTKYLMHKLSYGKFDDIIWGNPHENKSAFIFWLICMWNSLNKRQTSSHDMVLWVWHIYVTLVSQYHHVVSSSFSSSKRSNSGLSNVPDDKLEQNKNLFAAEQHSAFISFACRLLCCCFCVFYHWLRWHSTYCLCCYNAFCDMLHERVHGVF